MKPFPSVSLGVFSPKPSPRSLIQACIGAERRHPTDASRLNSHPIALETMQRYTDMIALLELSIVADEPCRLPSRCSCGAALRIPFKPSCCLTPRPVLQPLLLSPYASLFVLTVP